MPTDISDTGPENSDKPDFLASLKLVSRFIGGSRLKLTLAISLATLSVAFDLVPLWVIYQLVSALIAGSASLTLFTGYALLTVVAIVLGPIFLGLAMWLSHLVAFDVLHKIRRAIARHMSVLPLGYFSDLRSGAVKKTIIDDPEQLELIVAHGLPEGISALATWIAVSVWLFVVDWRLAIATIFLAPFSFFIMGSAMGGASDWVKKFQRAEARMNASTVEYLAGMQVVKVFNRTGESFAETSEAVRDYAEHTTNWARAFLPVGSTFNVLLTASIVLILPTGVWLMSIGQITLPTLLFFVIMGANYSQPLIKLFNQFHTLAQLSLSSSKIDDLFATKAQKDTGARFNLPHHDVVFDGVDFSYGATQVLHGVSFTAKTGEVTALAGLSGSGKSTIASLIPRFWDVGAGRITIGGVDIRDIGLDQLMDDVAFVFQDTFLFSDTVAANIRFGAPDASDKDVFAAAKAAQAHDFITALPEGYDTKLDEQGRSLSGGERQRLALARAMLKNAPVVVLDEATAFADPDNEAAIQQAIAALTKGKTLIVIAHRLHTIANADQILVVDEGHIAESGKHDALIKRGGIYAQLWQDYSEARSISLRQSTLQQEAPQ